MQRRPPTGQLKDQLTVTCIVKVTAICFTLLSAVRQKHA